MFRLRCPGNTTLGKDDAKDIEQADLQPRERRRVDRDAFGKPTRQVATVQFRREDWPDGYRVFAMRTTESNSGHAALWDDLDYSVHVYVTSDWLRDIDDLARFYDDRAGIEPLIAELKNGIGKASTSDFDAAFLLKLLAYNLMRRWVVAHPLKASEWRASWIRRARLTLPARLLRSGGR